ncbi:hypothetical protein CEP52_014856 [Fusarium oligoseptatum]|uniref:Uncharacterized protein n=1 Tax=Fusarium oligoseptatum TaxID=2604345 RepID=A0A428SIQ3_9HYPO|nr:hypothetical protein CEP52_014856 [Fusarium oligoseptatum]
MALKLNTTSNVDAIDSPSLLRCNARVTLAINDFKQRNLKQRNLKQRNLKQRNLKQRNLKQRNLGSDRNKGRL